MKKTFDKLQIGLVPGLLVPVLALVGFYFYRTKGAKPLFDFLSELVQLNIVSALVSLCVIPNLLLFFAFIWTDRYQSSRGVILATFVYAIVILILKGV